MVSSRGVFIPECFRHTGFEFLLRHSKTAFIFSSSRSSRAYCNGVSVDSCCALLPGETGPEMRLKSSSHCLSKPQKEASKFYKIRQK